MRRLHILFCKTIDLSLLQLRHGEGAEVTSEKFDPAPTKTPFPPPSFVPCTQFHHTFHQVAASQTRFREWYLMGKMIDEMHVGSPLTSELSVCIYFISQVVLQRLHNRLRSILEAFHCEMDVNVTVFQGHLCSHLFHEVKHYPVLYLGQNRGGMLFLRTSIHARDEAALTSDFRRPNTENTCVLTYLRCQNPIVDAMLSMLRFQHPCPVTISSFSSIPPGRIDTARKWA